MSLGAAPIARECVCRQLDIWAVIIINASPGLLLHGCACILSSEQGCSSKLITGFKGVGGVPMQSTMHFIGWLIHEV